MRLDYDEEKIITMTIILGVCGFFGGVGLQLVGLYWWCKRVKWDFWEWLDALGPLLLVMSGFLGVTFGSKKMVWGILGIVGFGCVNWISKRYRKFGWYKSGKPGFVGIVSIMLWSLFEIVVATLVRGGIYLWGLSVQQWECVVLLSVGAMMLYLRAGLDVSYTFKSLWRKKRPKLIPK